MARKRQSQASRRREQDRLLPMPEKNPCMCDADCPVVVCKYTCMGGHANYPDSHTCANLHQWGDRSLTA